MKTFKTPKGTELPFLDLRGKDYLQVMHRLVWFREQCPDWGIETEAVKLSDDSSIFRATIRSSDGRIISQATGSETAKDFKDHTEKSETKAIGRALALCGFGTQFAPELDEGDRLVDSPAPKKAYQERADTIGFGKFKGLRFEEVEKGELINYCQYLNNSPKKSKEVELFLDNAREFLKGV
jgi:hypothetical protein